MTQSPRKFFLHKLRSIPVEIVLVNSKHPYDRLLHLSETPMANFGEGELREMGVSDRKPTCRAVIPPQFLLKYR